MSIYLDDSYPEDWDDDDDDFDYRYPDLDLGSPPEFCGPDVCGECWGGDGLCQREIDAMEYEFDHFYERYVSEMECPICKTTHELVCIPDVDELWQWPGDINPMIGLQIFGPYDCAKGIAHEIIEGRFYDFHHIWIGTGEGARQKIIMLEKDILDVDLSAPMFREEFDEMVKKHEDEEALQMIRQLEEDAQIQAMYDNSLSVNQTLTHCPWCEKPRSECFYDCIPF